MLIKIPRGWNLPERLVTPEHLVATRRQALGAGVIGGALLMSGAGRRAFAADAPAADAAAGGKYPPLRPTTPEKDATTYNNYYEFSTDKDLWESAQALKMSPWSISFDGLVDKPRTLGLEDLLKQVPLEDRIYRHRCVEAWSMVVPWTGFPMAKLIALAAPTSAAKYVVFQTVADKKTMPGLRQPWYPWPYTDGLTMAEATNDVAFIVTGMYGKPLPPQNGGPIRIHVPWKYGFKSVKSVIKVTFTDTQPVNFWQKLQSSEYGFWANVNPAVPHPRWSQATERVLGTGDRVPTMIYNGYGEWVADIYKDLTKERLFA
jgi:sulfoxide reductase catalytic subunit YedY